MPVKIARSAPRPSFGLPELLVAIHTSGQSCCKAGKARIFTPVRESSGESRFGLARTELPRYFLRKRLNRKIEGAQDDGSDHKILPEKEFGAGTSDRSWGFAS